MPSLGAHRRQDQELNPHGDSHIKQHRAVSVVGLQLLAKGEHVD